MQHFCPFLLLSKGIVAYGSGFIIALFQTGGLYYVEPENNVTEVMVPLGDLSFPDGLELVTEEDGTKTLYVTEGAGQISVFKIAMMDGATAPSADLLGVLTTDGYATPGTSAVVGDILWTANLHDTSVLPAPGENNTATFNTTFTVVGVNRFVDLPVTSPAPAPTAAPGPPTAPAPTPTEAPTTPTSGAFTIQNIIGIVVPLLFPFCLQRL